MGAKTASRWDAQMLKERRVRERKREGERKKETERGRERERESESETAFEKISGTLRY